MNLSAPVFPLVLVALLAGLLLLVDFAWGAEPAVYAAFIPAALWVGIAASKRGA